MNEEPDISSILIESGFYCIALNLMIVHPHNSVLHDIILQFFLLICSRGITTLVFIIYNTYTLHFLYYYYNTIPLFWIEKLRPMLFESFWLFFLFLIWVDEEEIKAVFNSTKLLEVIGEAWQSRSSPSTPSPSQSHFDRNNNNSYFGHLAILATVIVDTSDKNASISNLVNQCEKWKLYVAPNLDDYNLQMISVSTIQ